MKRSSRDFDKPGGTSPPARESRSKKSRSGSGLREPYRIILESPAERDLETLTRVDRRTAERISRKLLSIARHPHPIELAVPLRNVTIGTHRFRIGTYRATFEIQGRTIYITRIAHRRQVYKK